MSSDKIPCTFEGCYQVFDTVESMKKHKARAKDEVHEWYCKKCDEDCEDDIAYLIHQISSRKHIACPMCGAEFKSESGRDRHVGISHRRRQELTCPGCHLIFETASGLMSHIEQNNCKVITSDDFYKHRSEQQIEREELEELEGSVYQYSNMKPLVGSEPDSNGGISLLDNERVNLERDWQGKARFDPGVISPHPPTNNVDPSCQGVSEMTMDNYPALKATRLGEIHPIQQDIEEGSQTTNLGQSGSDLLGPQSEPEAWSAQPENFMGDNNVWQNNTIASSGPRAPRAPRAPSSNLLDTVSSVGSLGSAVTSQTAATRGSRQSRATGRSDLIPPAAKAENQDPNAPYAQVQTQAPKPRLPSRLDLQRYWNSIQECYICPGSRCGQRILSVQEFEQHLLSSAHVGGKVQCPSCLKKFKTTTALVAHAESWSTKCDLKNSAEYDLALRSMTAGLIRLDGTWRDGNVKYESVPVSKW